VENCRFSPKIAVFDPDVENFATEIGRFLKNVNFLCV